MIVDYSTLKTEILTASKRGDMATRAPFFVQRAEAMIAARVRSFYNTASVLLGESDRVSGGIYNAPADCLDIVRAYDGDALLERQGLVALMAYSVTGGGVHSFALRGGTTGRLQIEFRAVPDAGYATLGILYYKRFATFVNDSDTNPLLVAHSDVYLNLALHWLHLDAHDIDMAQIHRALADTELDKIDLEARRALRAGSVASLAQIKDGSAY